MKLFSSKILFYFSPVKEQVGAEMPSTQKPMRYGHTEGHTDVCFDDTGR